MLQKIFYKLFSKKNKTKAFTLIEVSVVLLIVGLMTGGVVGGKKLITKYQKYSDTKKFREASMDDNFKKDLKFNFSFENMQGLRDGDEITKVQVGDYTIETISDDELKDAYGENIDISQYKNPTYSNSVCGASGIKFGSFGDDDECRTRPLKITGGKFDLTEGYMIFISLSLKDGNYNKNTISGAVTNNIKNNCTKENPELCNKELFGYETLKSGGLPYVNVLTGTEESKLNKGRLMEDSSCGNVLTYSSIEEDKKKIKLLHINNMEAAENIIGSNDISVHYNEGKLYIGSCMHKGAEISKIQLYSKRGMTRSYVSRKLRSIFFPRSRGDLRSANKDKIGNEVSPRMTRRGIFIHEKRRRLINTKNENCTTGVIKGSKCLRDICIINKTTSGNGQNDSDLDPLAVINRNSFVGYDIVALPSDEGTAISCSNTLNSNKYSGSLIYNCSDAGMSSEEKQAAGGGKINILKNNCVCGEGYAWNENISDCSPIVCYIPRSELINTAGDLFDECIVGNFIDDELAVEYTAPEGAYFNISEDCTGTGEYTCNNNGVYTVGIEIN